MTDKLSPEIEESLVAIANAWLNQATDCTLDAFTLADVLRAQRLGGREDVWTAVFNWLSQNNGTVAVGAGLRTLRNEMRK